MKKKFNLLLLMFFIFFIPKVNAEEKNINLSNSYKNLHEYFEKNELKKWGAKNLIEKFDRKGYKFIVTVADQEYPHYPSLWISEDNESFGVNYSSKRFDTKFTKQVYHLSTLNMGENFVWENMTPENVDLFIEKFEKEKDITIKASNGTDWWSDSEIVKVPILYSSFNDDFVNWYNAPKFVINNQIFTPSVPTFNGYYNNYLKIESHKIPKDYKKIVLKKDKYKEVKVWFNVPKEQINTLDYIMESKKNFFTPQVYLYDEEKKEWTINTRQKENNWANRFEEKLFNDISIKPTITRGYLNIDLYTAEDNTINFYYKSDNIINIEYIPYSKDDEYIKVENLQGYKCYTINEKEVEEFRLNINILQDKKVKFGDFRYFSLNQQDLVNQPLIEIYSGIHIQPKIYKVGEKKEDKLYTYTMFNNINLTTNDIKGSIVLSQKNMKDNTRLCVKSDYILDYNIKKKVKTDQDKTEGDWIKEATKFIKNLGQYTREFFGLISYFISKLPVFIKNALICMFIVLITSGIIKYTRR